MSIAEQNQLSVRPLTGAGGAVRRLGITKIDGAGYLQVNDLMLQYGAIAWHGQAHQVKKKSKANGAAEKSANQDQLVAPLSWAQRLKRVFSIDIALCPLCGGTMRVIADITDPDIIQRILDHVEAQPPPNQPATVIQS